MRHFASIRLVLTGALFLATACGGQTRPPADGSPPSAEPAISVSPGSAGRGADVEIQASGFFANTTVVVGFGPPNSEYSVIKRVRTDSRGRVSTTARVPEWAEQEREYVFVVAGTDHRLKAISGRFLVESSP